MQQREPCLFWALSCWLMFLQLLLLAKKVLWDVSIRVLADVPDLVQVVALEDVSLYVLVRVKVAAQVVDMIVQGHAKEVVRGHANIRVLDDNLQDSLCYKLKSPAYSIS